MLIQATLIVHFETDNLPEAHDLLQAINWVDVDARINQVDVESVEEDQSDYNPARDN